MLSYESDYIMRMIHMLRLLCEYLAGMTDAQLLQGGDDAIRAAMLRLTGLSPEVSLSLSSIQLAQMLGEDSEGLSRCFALAELLRMSGDLQERFGHALDAQKYHRKAFSMYVQAHDAPIALLETAYPLVQTLFLRFFQQLSEQEYLFSGNFFERAGYFCMAEDAYCAQNDLSIPQHFYMRLSQLPAQTLVQGGFTQTEVEEGYARICHLQETTVDN